MAIPGPLKKMNPWSGLFLFFLFISTSTANSGLQSAEEVKRTGQIPCVLVDSEGQPVQSATIWIIPLRNLDTGDSIALEADETGHINLPALDGVFDMVGVDPFENRVVYQRKVNLTSLEKACRIVFSKGGVIKGRVIDSSRSEVITLGSIRLEHMELGRRFRFRVRRGGKEIWVRRGVITRDGSFNVSGLLPGKYRITGEIPGYAVITREALVRPGEETRLDLEAIPGGTRYIVQVKNDVGRPLSGALIWLRPESGGGRRLRALADMITRRLLSDADGRVVFYGVEPDTEFRVMADARPHGMVFTDVQSFRGPEESITIHIPKGATLQGRLMDEEGRPPEKITPPRFVLREPRFAFNARPAFEASENEGTFIVRGLPEGELTMIIQIPHYQPVVKTITISGEGEIVDLGDVKLTRGAKIHGIVHNDLGVPLGTATVQAFPSGRRGSFSGVRWEVSTRADGTFEMDGLDPEGEYMIWVTAEKHVPAIMRRVQPGDREIRVVLQRAAGLRGRVIDTEGNPIQGYSIKVFVQSPGMFRMLGGDADYEHIIFDEDGRFDLDDIPPGNGLMLIEVPGYGRREMSVSLTAGIKEDMGDIIIEKGCPVALSVRDEQGAPVSLARISLQRVGTPRYFAFLDLGAEGVTDINGEADLGVLSPGDYKVSVHHPDFASAERELTLESSCQMTPSSIVLYRGGRLLICVQDDSNNGIEGVRVRVRDPVKNTILDDRQSDESGCLETARLEPGEVSIQAVVFQPESGQYRTVTKQARIENGKDTPVTLRICDKVIWGDVAIGSQPVLSGTLRFTPLLSGQPPQVQVVSLNGSSQYEICLPSAEQYEVIFTDDQGRQIHGKLSNIVVDPETGRGNYPLHFPDTSLFVQVIESETGRPISGVIVTYTSSDDGFQATCRTGSSGSCELVGFTLSPGFLKATHPRYTSVSVPFEETENFPAQYQLEMTRGAILWGRVTDRNGAPVTVRSQLVGIPVGRYNRRLQLGEYRYENLPLNKPFTLIVSSDGLAPVYREGLVMLEPEHRLDFVLETGRDLQIRVVDNSGRPLHEANVRILTPGGAELTEWCGPERVPSVTDMNGTIRFFHIPTMSPVTVEVSWNGRTVHLPMSEVSSGGILTVVVGEDNHEMP